MQDSSALHRFVEAQDAVWSSVRAELQAGRKRTHWMWFIFPQLAGLGHSATARRYAISSLHEAKDYLAHDVLGTRLREATGLVNAVESHTVHEIFGSPDDMKFHSCITLFNRAEPGERVFEQALAKYFRSQPDQLTLVRLA